jgi:uncharacterized integral membrane protein
MGGADHRCSVPDLAGGVHFLGFNGHLPLGLTILISAIIGLLIAAVLGSIRIMQLRRALKRNTPPDQRVVR